jgi:hypothetical protein
MAGGGHFLSVPAPPYGNHIVTRFEFLNTSDMLSFTNEQSGILAPDKCPITLSAVDNGSIARVGASAPFDYYVLRDHSTPVWDLIHSAGAIFETAGVNLAIGNVLSINSSGDMILADSLFSNGEWEVAAISKAVATATNPVPIAQTGMKTPVLFGSAPAASANGSGFFREQMESQPLRTSLFVRST